LKARSVIALILVVIPCLLQAEVLFLKDGSSLVGKLVRVDGDTLYFQPSFGGLLQFDKSSVWRIQFDESENVPGSNADIGQPAMPGMNTAEPGSLIVTFDGMKISNKIVIHRKRNYEELERANAIKSALIIDGLEVASVIDSTTDKVYRDGPDTYLKNTIHMPNFRVKLDSGPHSCLIVIENIGGSDYEKHFESSPLDQALNVDNVVIYPKRNTTLEIGVKRGSFKLGKPKLYLKRYR
jgi:hypothetical protein